MSSHPQTGSLGFDAHWVLRRISVIVAVAMAVVESTRKARMMLDCDIMIDGSVVWLQDWRLGIRSGLQGAQKTLFAAIA
jgi:hypothetical protein